MMHFICISGYGEEFYAYYLWNSLGFFTASIAVHVLVNGLMYDTSSITGGYFMKNVAKIAILGDFCHPEECWSVHAASLTAIMAALFQICTIFAARFTLFRTKYKTDDCVSMSYYEEMQSLK